MGCGSSTTGSEPVEQIVQTKQWRIEEPSGPMSVTEADTEINPTEMAAENKNDMK